MEVSARALSIARILTESTAEYVLSADIADVLGVSVKTVSRQLPEVEAIFAKFNLRLVRKTGAGLAVDGGTKGLLAFRQAFAGELKNVREVYGVKDRQKVIISRLLSATEPIKLYALATALSVTDGTVSGDLDKIAPWFAAHNLILVRKPGLGVYIEGTERDLRRAAIEHIYDNVESGELIELLAG